MRHRLVIASMLLFVPLASACDLIDEPCPEGYWRPRAMHECEPLPVHDAGTDAGISIDAGPAPTDAAVELDAQVDLDAAVDLDAQVDDAGPIDDAAIDAGDAG